MMEVGSNPKTRLKLSIRQAVEADAKETAVLRMAAANDLTTRFGKGFWSSNTTDKGVLQAMRRGKVIIAVDAGAILGTLTLSTQKPWAIDTSYFTPVQRPIYLTSMAVLPALQNRGVGRAMLDAVDSIAKAWPGQAIRLDAFDAEAGAGAFYTKCGYQEKGRAIFRAVPLIYFEKLLRDAD
jgi:ribosomal protein S18 acetylase RimI-like enzyme